MIHSSTKALIRGFSTLALCTCFTFGSASAFDGDPELAFTEHDSQYASAVSVLEPVSTPIADQTEPSNLDKPLARTVVKSHALIADSEIRSQGKPLGSFRLSFYCPCEKCCGTASTGQTKLNTQVTEGRTIAVDPNVIPLGSRVFIEGYGVFIAEDIGGAIQGNKIDIAVSDHTRAYELGVDTANVYLLN